MTREEGLRTNQNSVLFCLALTCGMTANAAVSARIAGTSRARSAVARGRPLTTDLTAGAGLTPAGFRLIL